MEDNGIQINMILKSKEDEELNLSDTISLFGTDTHETKSSVSQNIGVFDMQFNLPHQEPLSFFERTAIAYVLRGCLDELMVLKWTIPVNIDEAHDNPFIYKSKFEDDYDDLEEIDNRLLKGLKFSSQVRIMNAEKLQRDRTYVYRVLEKILNEVKKYGKYQSLQDEIKDNDKIIEGERAIKNDHEIRSALLLQQRSVIELQGRKNKEELEHLRRVLQEASIKSEDLIFSNASQLEFTKSWEDNRIQQNLYIMKLEEKQLLKELNECKKKETAECIISENIQVYLQKRFHYLENETEYWNDRCNSEISERQMENFNLNDTISERKEVLQELYDSYYNQQAWIDEYRAEEARLQIEREHLENMNRAATKIQSFWRGYMVRHKLGEFRGLWSRLQKKQKNKRTTTSRKGNK